MTAPRIRPLSRDLVNKIAAGEVVERPASVLKELVENAIDAEASHIEVVLENGGKRLIRVSDDGVGIAHDDLPLAFQSHATSKISADNDLFEIYTLGFRGEALASIGSVAHCRIVSRERGADSGASLECNGGTLGEVKSCGAPHGTIIEVRDLFFNTPARLKFMRTVPTELRHATEALTRLALPHPQLSLHLMHGKRTVLKLESCQTARERLGAVFGDNLCAGLLPLHSESTAMSVSGFVSAPGNDMPRSMLYVFLNGRYIRDRAIYRAVAEAFRNRIPRGRFPAVFLNLQMDPRRVDVNVHPTKIEVRFRDSGAVFAQILTALEKTLSAAGPVKGQVLGHSRPERRERVKNALSDFFEQGAHQAKPPAGAAQVGSSPPAPGPSAAAPATEVQPSRAPSPPATAPDAPPKYVAPPVAAPVAAPPPPASSGPRTFCQLHNAYIVEEVNDGFLVIDQHALHERILYEELQRRVSRAAVPRQRLLMPELIEMRPQDFLRIMEIKEELLHLGIEVEAFGERTVAVHAVPHLAGALDARELLLGLLEDDDESASGQTANRQDHIMKMIACKAAIKAGDHLRREQIEALLEQRDRLGPEPTCPHGRPTTLRYELRELERMFRRK